jgi:Zn-finger nucleic acid-binding protein
MLCPACQSGLAIADRQGIEIDYCPQCRGIWLDRGELDKIVERAALAAFNERPLAREPSPSDRSSSGSPRRNDDSDDDHFRRGGREREAYSEDGRYDRYRKTRGSWLGELFDFG